jgi:hypothetical protein
MNPSNVFNIEGTLNQWLRTGLEAYIAPSFFSGFPGSRLILVMPENPMNTPVFSAGHLFIETQERWQGNAGDNGTLAHHYEAFLDVNIWVSRINTQWVADKRWMSTILTDLVNKTKSVTLTEYLDDYPNTSSGVYTIYIDNIEARQTEQDVNPDIERERFLIKYHTIIRSNG